jgi:flagellar biosynthetic protein FliO
MIRRRLFLLWLALALAGLLLHAGAALGAATDGVAPLAARGAPAARSEDTAAGRPAETGGLAEYRFAEPTGPNSLLWDSLRLVLTLAAVLGLLGISLKLLRRWGTASGRILAPGALEVLGRLALGSKEAVCLVRVGTEVLVVGVCPQSLTLLHRLDGASLGVGGQAGPLEPSRRLQGGAPPSSLRLRELARRLRDVQMAWGVPRTPRGGAR